MAELRESETTSDAPRLRRALTLRDLLFYGIVLVQPTAPMPLFGVVSVEARGHVVVTVLLAMLGMLFTAISYGRMARAYPTAGSAYTYVGREIHPAMGYLAGWSMAMDYMLNPILCTIWCSKAVLNILPGTPYAGWVVFFTVLFTALNLRAIKASARTNEVLAAGLGVVIVVFALAALRYLLNLPLPPGALTRPFYDPATFSVDRVLAGSSIAALTYIGFDGISTLSEEVENPRRNILLGTVLTCLVTGMLASFEVYLAQLVWPEHSSFPNVETAFVHVAGRAGGPWMLHLVNFSLLLATIGSGSGAQLGAARLLYGMGRENTLPKSFFGVLDPKRAVPRNNVLFLGAVTLAGGFLLSYQLSAELLNFGAFIAFMGVNLAALIHYYVRGEEKKIGHLVPPVLGFVLCFYLWFNLRWIAKVAGSGWLLFGVVYGTLRSRALGRGAAGRD